MSDWKARLRDHIEFTSPSGKTFTALWQDDDISGEKRVGKFNYPFVTGTETQDLGMNGLTYPLTVFFEGADHDKTAWSFIEAWKETGTWTVVHPVYGKKTLQPISFTFAAHPVSSGNVTKVASQWFEPTKGSSTASSAQLAAKAQVQAAALSASAARQLQANADISSADGVQAVVNGSKQNLAQTKSSLRSIAEKSADALAKFDSVYAATQASLSSTPLDLLTIAGQTSQLIQSPLLALNDISSTFAIYSSMASNIIASLPTDVTTAAKNLIALGEHTLTSILSALGIAVTTTTPKTRPQAIQTIEDLKTQFDSITNALDTAQKRFQTKPIDEQYFSQSQAYADASMLIGVCTDYLLSVAFSLKVEKRFTLDRPRAPIEITITEYGDLGDGDANFDEFIAANSLTNKEIIRLPAGREVVVYV